MSHSKRDTYRCLDGLDVFNTNFRPRPICYSSHVTIYVYFIITILGCGAPVNFYSFFNSVFFNFWFNFEYYLNLISYYYFVLSLELNHKKKLSRNELLLIL